MLQTNNIFLQLKIRYEQSTREMLSPEQFFLKLKRRWMERTVYTRTIDKFEIPPSQVPPLLAPSVMGDKLHNTEMEKNSVHLKANSQPTGKNLYHLALLTE